MATPNLLLTKLIKELNDAAAKWHEIGLQVGISPGELETIKADKNTSEACLTAVCTRLVQSGDEETVILDKVNSALQSVNRPDIAKRISESYRPTERTPLMSSKKLSSIAHSPSNNNKWRKGIIMIPLALVILILFTATILTTLNYKNKLNLPRTQDTQECTLDFTIEKGDSVVVPNDKYPKSDVISVNLSHIAKSSKPRINLYKVSSSLPPLSKDIDKNATMSIEDTFYLLDYRYVLEGTTLDITLNFTNLNTEVRCPVRAYMFDNHESFDDFNNSLRHGEEYNRLLPHYECIQEKMQQKLISDITKPYYVFMVLNTTTKIQTRLTYRINGTQTYYNASGYPVFCSFPQGSNKYCNVTIAPSQDMILALTNDTKQGSDFEPVDLHYNISVYSETVEFTPAYVTIWTTAAVLVFIMISVCALIVLLV